MSPERVGGLKQHAAHAAHVEDIRAGAPGAHVASGGGVGPALGLGLPQQPDIHMYTKLVFRTGVHKT